MTSIFQAGQPFNIVRTSSATYQANDKDLVISSGDEVALPSPNQGATILVRPAPSIGSVKITTSNGTIGNTGDTFGFYRATEPIYLVGDGTDWYARSGGGEISAIPDSAVARDSDDNTETGNANKDGIQIETDVEWPDEFDGRISDNTSGATRAYIHRSSDGTLIGDVDISDLSAGDTFTVPLDSALQTDETYNFVLDAEGSNWDLGFDTDADYPYTSDDGDLSIVNGAIGETDSNSDARAISEVGNLS